MEIRAAEFPAHLAVVRALFQDYAAGLGFDLGFQDFAGELADLPGKYAPPRGRLLLAWLGEGVVGCVALRPIDAQTCEMKRLYLRPGLRGSGLGRKLVERICTEARQAGYGRICLDTVPQMKSAIALYTHLGFAPVAPYVHNPIAGALFLGRAL